MSSCCTPDHSCSSATATVAVEGVVTAYTVTGMTCGHCESSVTKAIGALDGVNAVKVDLAAGTVTVTSASALDDKAIADAVDEAGYELAGRA